MLLHILLVCHIIVCVLLIGFVLMQQSEGGALGMGGGPSGFMTARGAGNFMTRATWILFSLFLVLSIILTVLAGRERASSSVLGRGAVIERIDPNSLNRPQVPTPAAPGAPVADPSAPLLPPAPQVNQPIGAAGALANEPAPAQPAPKAQ